MKYFFIIFLFFYFVGCDNKKNINSQQTEITISNETIKSQPKIIKVDDLEFIENNNTFSYHFENQVILFFSDDSKESKLEQKELKSLNKKFYIIKKPKLIEFFKIVKYPTILIIDKNNTKKFEGFIPAIMLKYEIKD